VWDWVRWALVTASVVLLACGAWSDLARRIIPNRVSAGVAVLGLAVRAMSGLPGLAGSLIVAIVMFAGLVFLHERKIMGGGDVKLATAVVLGLPVGATWLFVEATVLAGGVLALAHLILRRVVARAPRPSDTAARRPLSTAGRVWAVERWRISRHGPLPYGVAIGCGGALALLSGG
jgi:prepilin peptidase CpaA